MKITPPIHRSSSIYAQQLYFCSPYFGLEESLKEEPQKKDKWHKRAARATKNNTKKLARKITHWQEFKTSVKQGKGKAIGDWHHAMDHHTKPQKAVRIAREVVGIPILIAFTFVPGPNPGWFISPTLSSFFKGFMQDTKAAEPERIQEAEQNIPSNPEESRPQ